MKAKALEFSDTDTAAKIMVITDPVQQKRLGKQVVDVVRGKGLSAKFSQNNDCKNFLRATKDKCIGEANPNDQFFGIGIGLGDELVWDRKFWAKNLLGKSLMQVREDL